jgi:hypothetical protein
VTESPVRNGVLNIRAGGRGARNGFLNRVSPARPWRWPRPAERFRLTPLAKGRASVSVDSKEDHRGQWVLRRIGSNGMVSVDNQLFSVTNAYKGELVDVFVEGTVIQVWSKNHHQDRCPRPGREGPEGQSLWATRQGSADYETTSISRSLTAAGMGSMRRSGGAGRRGGQWEHPRTNRYTRQPRAVGPTDRPQLVAPIGLLRVLACGTLPHTFTRRGGAR